MTNEPSGLNSSETLLSLMGRLWVLRWFVLAGGIVGALLAAAIQGVSVPQYRASMIVGPANPVNGAEISSLLADDNLFALRFLAQRLGNTGSSDFMRFETIVKGPSLAGVLLKNQTVREQVARDKAFVFSSNPRLDTPERLAEYLARQVTLEPVGGTPLRKMTYTHPDPDFAVRLLTVLHAIGDSMIRGSIRREAAERIQYLEEAIDQTPNPEHRRALTTLLMEQERLVSIDQPYAAVVVEPAAVLSRPVWPDPYMLYGGLAAAFAFVGFLIGQARQAAVPGRRG